MSERSLSIYILSVALAIGFLGGSWVALADTPSSLLSGVRERYNNQSLPSRDDLLGELPELPTSFPLDPTVAREQGARELRAMDLRQDQNPDTIMNQINGISAESANPNRLLGDIPSPVASLGSSILHTDTSTSSGQANSSASNSPADPLGQDPSTADQQQSTLTRTANGTLPNGSLDVSGGDPAALSLLLAARSSQDVRNSYLNYVSTLFAMNLQSINLNTAFLAGKLDALNDSHRQLNEHAKELADVTKVILQKLPTIPHQ